MIYNILEFRFLLITMKRKYKKCSGIRGTTHKFLTSKENSKTYKDWKYEVSKICGDKKINKGNDIKFMKSKITIRRINSLSSSFEL